MFEMPNVREIVINTGPLIALVAATGDLDVLRKLYRRVLVPFEVTQEMLVKGTGVFAHGSFVGATWLTCWQEPVTIDPILAYSLGKGEASVIRLALKEKVHTVCIDETSGRRVARLYDLSVTGSLGVLVRAKQEGLIVSLRPAIKLMKERGIWLSDTVTRVALEEANES